MLRTMTLAGVATLGILGWTAAPSEAAPPFSPPPPHFRSHRHMEVQYRLPYWKEQTFTCPIEAGEFERERLSKGFEVNRVRHGLHIHVNYRMPYWNTYQTVHGHDRAHEVERYLERSGFDARVVHHPHR